MNDDCVSDTLRAFKEEEQASGQQRGLFMSSYHLQQAKSLDHEIDMILKKGRPRVVINSKRQLQD